MNRCAIVEAYNRHDEVYLTTIHLLARLGWQVEVFTTWRNLTRNSLVYAPGLDVRLRTRLPSSRLLDPRTYDRFDLVVFNTLEGPAVLDAARAVLARRPVIGFVHNASFVRERPGYAAFADAPRARLAVLAPYVREHLRGAADPMVMLPVFFHDRPLPARRGGDGRRVFCVQGYFDPTRRAYGALADALQALAAEGRDDVAAHVMGRSFSPAFAAFRADLARRGLAARVRYSWKGIGYRAYYRLLAGVDFLLPLVTPASHPDYFAGKVTSTMAAALGFGAVPVAHERLAACYDLADAAFGYDGDLTGAMRRALDADAAELAARRAAVGAARERWLERSQQELAGTIERLLG